MKKSYEIRKYKKSNHSKFQNEKLKSCLSLSQNFETNMFCFRAASSILVRLLATWSVFVCRRNIIAT